MTGSGRVGSGHRVKNPDPVSSLVSRQTSVAKYLGQRSFFDYYQLDRRTRQTHTDERLLCLDHKLVVNKASGVARILCEGAGHKTTQELFVAREKTENNTVNKSTCVAIRRCAALKWTEKFWLLEVKGPRAPVPSLGGYTITVCKQPTRLVS